MKVARILAREREEVLTDFPGVGVIRGRALVEPRVRAFPCLLVSTPIYSLENLWPKGRVEGASWPPR